jgi:hypothetical protein
MGNSLEYQIWKETLIKILGIKATELLEKKVKERMECEGNSLKTDSG